MLVAPVAAVAAAPAGCPQFFAGGVPPTLVNPKLAGRSTLLCNAGYAAVASGITHGALWSAEHPTRDSLEAARGIPREGEFHPEDRLAPKDQAQLEDYRDSGYDRGHMTPSGDMPDADAQQQTFSLANMVPQTPALNREIWALIEMSVRRLAEREGELYVVTGPAFAGQQVTTIGPGAVLVPSATWKAVYDPRAGGTGVYVCSNTAAPRCAVVTVETLTRVVGIDPFPALPATLKRQAMALSEPGANGHPARRHRERAGLLERLFR